MDMFLFIKLLFVTELFFGGLLFAPILHRRSRFWLRLVLAYAAVMLYAAFIPGKFGNIPITIAVFASIAVLSIFSFALFFREKAENIVFVGVASYTAEKISSMLNSIGTLAAPELFEHVNVFNPYWFLLYLGCAAVTYLCFYLFFVRYIRNCREGMLYIKAHSVVAILPVATAVNLVMGWLSTFYITGWPIVQLFDYVWNLLACILLLVVEYCILDRNKIEYDLEISQELIRQKEEQYRFSKENIALINRKCHDIKYIIRASAMEGGESAALREAIEGVEIYDRSLKTGNETLDLLLAEKGLYCRGKGIELNCMADGKLLDFFENVDLYVLFGNLLDNAIRSTEKLTDPADRIIYLRISHASKFIVISVENRFEGEVRLVRGMPVTTKENREQRHGYGLLGVKYLVEKYGGGLSIKTEEGTFLIDILFPAKD